MTFKASSKELSLFICKCSKLIFRYIQMAFPLPAITLKSLEFRLCSSYRSREVVIPQAPPPFLSFPLTYVFWKIEKRYTLQRTEGSTANGKHPAHISSTWLPRGWRSASASQRQEFTQMKLVCQIRLPWLIPYSHLQKSSLLGKVL